MSEILYCSLRDLLCWVTLKFCKIDVSQNSVAQLSIANDGEGGITCFRVDKEVLSCRDAPNQTKPNALIEEVWLRNFDPLNLVGASFQIGNEVG